MRGKGEEGPRVRGKRRVTSVSIPSELIRFQKSCTKSLFSAVLHELYLPGTVLSFCPWRQPLLPSCHLATSAAPENQASRELACFHDDGIYPKTLFWEVIFKERCIIIVTLLSACSEKD